jgi:hypothetical protein
VRFKQGFLTDDASSKVAVRANTAAARLDRSFMLKWSDVTAMCTTAQRQYGKWWTGGWIMDGSPVADSRRSRVLRDQQMNVEFTMSRMGNQARTIHLMVFGIIAGQCEK